MCGTSAPCTPLAPDREQTVCSQTGVRWTTSPLGVVDLWSRKRARTNTLAQNPTMAPQDDVHKHGVPCVPPALRRRLVESREQCEYFKEAAFAAAARHEVKKLVGLMRKRIDRIYDDGSEDEDDSIETDGVPVEWETCRGYEFFHHDIGLNGTWTKDYAEANDLPDDAKKRGCAKFKELAMKALRSDEFKEFSWMADLTEQFEAGRKLYEALDDEDKMQYDKDADDGKVIRYSHDPFAEDINDGDNNDGLAVSCMPRLKDGMRTYGLFFYTGYSESWDAHLMRIDDDAHEDEWENHLDELMERENRRLARRLKSGGVGDPMDVEEDGDEDEDEDEDATPAAPIDPKDAIIKALEKWMRTSEEEIAAAARVLDPKDYQLKNCVARTNFLKVWKDTVKEKTDLSRRNARTQINRMWLDLNDEEKLMWRQNVNPKSRRDRRKPGAVRPRQKDFTPEQRKILLQAMKETVSTDKDKIRVLAIDIGEDSEEGRRRVKNFYDKHKKEILELERIIVERVDKLGVRIKDFVWRPRPEHDPLALKEYNRARAKALVYFNTDEMRLTEAAVSVLAQSMVHDIKSDVHTLDQIKLAAAKIADVAKKKHKNDDGIEIDPPKKAATRAMAAAAADKRKRDAAAAAAAAKS